MSNDWKRVGEFAAARRRQLGLTQPEVHKRGGPSAALVRAVEKGAYTASMQATVKRGYEAALQWEAHSIDLILDGDEPVPLSEDAFRPPLAHVRPDRDSIDEVSVRAERLADGSMVFSAASLAHSADGEHSSRVELRYWPGAGRRVHPSDMAPVVGDVHRAALRLTVPDERQGGDGNADTADAGGPAPTRTYPTLVDEAAREDD